MEDDIRDALARARDLREQGRRGLEQSVALHALSKQALERSQALKWQARDCRADVIYSRLLARVRGSAPARTLAAEETGKPDVARLLEENRELSRRIADLLEDREAFVDALQRYLEIERSFAALKARSNFPL